MCSASCNIHPTVTLFSAEFDSLSLLDLPSGTVLNETTGTIPACVVVSGTRASDETVTFTIVSGTASKLSHTSKPNIKQFNYNCMYRHYIMCISAHIYCTHCHVH